MNVIQVAFWDLMTIAGAVVVVFSGCLWALLQVIVKQFTSNLDVRFKSQDELRQQREKTLDERFKALEKMIKSEGDGWRVLEKEFMALKAEMPLHYVRREDNIRQEVVMHTKLDALATKIDALIKEGVKYGG